jgi:hypothetical protein
MTSLLHDSADRIRALAHKLWEQEGRPEGRADIHWRQAEELVRAESDKPAKKARLTRKKAKVG